jgi:hypothetical protein
MSTARQGSPEAGAPGGAQVGEECFVLLVGLERVDLRPPLSLFGALELA